MVALVAILGGGAVEAHAVQRNGYCAEALQSVSTKRKLTLVSYNARDLEVNENGGFSKPEKLMWQLTEALVRREPDVIVLQEVGSLEVLENFVRYYLHDQYEVYFNQAIPHNVHNIGFLVRKTSGLEAQIETHAREMWVDPVDHQLKPLFHHDAPALLIYEKKKSKKKPLMVLIGHHGKSKKHRRGDPESRALREAQIRGLRRMVDSYHIRFGNDLVVAVAGDFNTELGEHRNSEMDAFRDMRDVFDINDLHPAQRVTHTYFPHDQPPEFEQIDAIFLNKSSRLRRVKSGVDYYRKDGRILPLPRNVAERDRQQPSDHYPLWATIEIQ